MKKAALTRSIMDRLADIANKQQIPFQNILTSFLLERMVARLIRNPELSDKLIFKGGYVGLRVFQSPRYTLDLDASIQKADITRIVLLAKEAMQADIVDGVWFLFEKEDELQTFSEYGGMRLNFRSGVGEPPKNVKKAQSIHLDLGLGDPVVPAPVQTETRSLLGEDSLSWRVYTIESTVAEKLHTLIIRHSDNSRAKDVYDLAYLLPKCNPALLKTAIAETFHFRGDTLPPDIPAALGKIDSDLLKRGWKSAVAGLKEQPDFDEAFTQITQCCKIVFPRM